MSRLEELIPNTAVRGILPDVPVTVVNVQWFGSKALELTYKGPDGRVANQLLYRHDEARLEVVEQGWPWSFDGDGALFRLVSEAHRIRLAHLFDPMLAVHTSVVEPLPHQITAVYEAISTHSWHGPSASGSGASSSRRRRPTPWCTSCPSTWPRCATGSWR